MNKKSSLLLVALLAVITQNVFAKKHTKVLGKVFVVKEYCGGARPSLELLNEMKIAKPFANKILVIKKGKMNLGENQPLIAKVMCNSNGEFNVELPPGMYCVLEEYKLKPFSVPKNTATTIYDSVCLYHQWQNADAIFEIKNSRRFGKRKNEPINVRLQFTQHCSWNIPCADYRGEFPPAAVPQEK
jgi:hypothetical protein